VTLLISQPKRIHGKGPKKRNRPLPRENMGRRDCARFHNYNTKLSTTSSV
jgi:hypothetical protein